MGRPAQPRISTVVEDLGEPVTEQPVCISGNPDIHRNGPYGHFLLKSGNCYHYKASTAGTAWRRSAIYGYKLEIVRNRQTALDWPQRWRLGAA